MTPSDASTFDFKRAAARQFAARPTLRQVVSDQLLTLLRTELPWLAYVQPALPSADALMLDSPDPSTPYWSTQPLVDCVLQAMLESRFLDLEPVEGRHYNLGVLEPYRFAGSHSAFDTRQLSGLSEPLNDLIEQLPQLFCEAQLGFWASAGSTGASRDHWLQLLLSTALLRGLPLQGLDAQEQACIRGLIRGGADQPTASFVQVQLTQGLRESEQLLSHLLVTGEWDERQVVLWCAPSGEVRGFASLAAFALALRDDLAQRYSFDAMSWQLYPVEGNVFAQQVSALLDTLFTQVDRVSYRRLKDVAALEQLFAQISDPAQWFDSYPDDTPAVKTPPALWTSSGSDSVAFRAGLLQLAVDQLDAEGVGAMDGILSLNDYTRQRLTEQMQTAHAQAISPDDLLIEFFVALGIPGGAGTGAGGGEPVAFEGSKTLTEFAIGNLGTLSGASIRRIRRADGTAAPAWLDANAANRLVSQIDVGGNYPAYVARLLDDPLQRAQRIKRFCREWRDALRFSALGAKLDGKITEAGLQCVIDFCAGHFDPQTPRMTLMPLTLRRQPHSRQQDLVRGMYVLFCAKPELVLLYRPLYLQDTLREYSTLAALLAHIQESTLLQASILDWLNPQVRHIYDHGGFLEPHITSIGIDPSSLPERPEPPVIEPVFWATAIDEKLYNANRDLLIELAGMQSTSNAERRWETLSQGAWLLFDVVSLALRGPVASVAWLVQLISSLENDLLALEQGGEFDRPAAVADLLLNLSMVLLHARQPASHPGTAGTAPDVSAFDGPAPQRGAFTEVSVAPFGGRAAAIGELAALPQRQLDFSWRGNQGFNWLAPEQRQALRTLRTGVLLPGSALQVTGETAGLYQVDGRLYAAMDADAYRVELIDGSVRVVDGKGGYGPWLSHAQGVWRVDGSLRLLGGMKRSTRKNLADSFRKYHTTVVKLNEQVTAASQRFTQVGASITDLGEKVTRLEALLERERGRLTVAVTDSEQAASRAIITTYETRQAEWEAQSRSKRNEAVELVEGIVRDCQEILRTINTMFEPKYARERLPGVEAGLTEQRREVQLSLIRNSDFIFNELWELAEYQELTTMQQRLHGRPVQQVLEAYQAYRRQLEGVVAFQDRMLAAFEHLDELLVDVPGEVIISNAPEPQSLTVDAFIAKRTFSTVQFRFHQVLNLADLALHLDSIDGQRTINVFREELSGLSLRNAGGAHGELDFANLPLEDRITILQEAWDEYAAALVNSLRIRETGEALIDVSMLDRYRTELEKLKRDAGRRLVALIKEQEGARAPDARLPYIISSEPQRAMRNAEGQILIGKKELDAEGQEVYQVRDPFNNSVLVTFDWRDGQWHERGREPAPAEPEIAATDTAFRMQALLDENDQLLLKADEYVVNDLKGTLLARLFDLQIDKLGQAATILGEEGANATLIRRLEVASDQMRSQKNLKLTMLYTDTRYPSADALRFLHEQNLIKVEYVAPRQVMANGSTFDEYKIMRLAQPGAASGRPLWAAHFHMPAADALARDFTLGHLKTWSQRRLSGREEGSTQRVHRGKLTLEQARGIIPFD